MKNATKRSLWTRLRQLNKSKSNLGSGRRRLWLESLEDRRVLAADFYVNDNWDTLVDMAPAGLSVGDTVINNNDTTNPGAITAAYGFDGFGTVTTGSSAGSLAGSDEISDAVAAAAAGDTINVLDGTYVESDELTLNKSLTITGAGQDTTIIQRAGSVIGTEQRTVEINADGVTIESLTLGGWEDPPLDANVGKGYLAWNIADNTTFDDVRFDADDNRVAIYTGTQDYLTVQDSRFTGSLFRAGIRGAGEHMLITGNSFEESHYWYSPIYFEYGGATSGEITYNYFANRVGVNNDVFGEFKEDGTGLYAITNFQPDTTTADGLLIQHNTFDFQDSNLVNDLGNSPIPVGVYIDPLVPASGPITIVDNIFQGYEYTGPQPSTEPLWMPGGGVFGGALEFDGDGDFGVFKDAVFDVGEQGSFALWINLDTLGKRHMLAGGPVEHQVRHSDDVYFYPGNLGSNNTLIWSSDTVSSGVWTHVAYTWDHSLQEGKIYLDGTEVNYRGGYDPDVSPYWTTIQDTVDKLVYLGRDPGNPGSRDFDGKMDDVAWFDDVLTPAEIADLMNVGVATAAAADPNLVAHWDFDQSSGNIAIDNKNGIELHLSTNGIVPFGPEFKPGMGQFGGALEFDGVDDFATFQDPSFDVGEKGTLNFWVNMDNTGKRNQFFEGPGNGGFEVQYRSSSGGQVYSRVTTDGDFVIRSGADAGTLAGNWTNIQVIYDFNGLPVADGGGSLRIFLNGVESTYLAGFTPTDLSWPGIVNTVDGLINVGRDPGKLDRYFDGLMDDVGWFNDVLTAAERDDIRTNGVADLAGDSRLVAHWDLDDAPGTTLVPGDSGTNITLYLQSEPPPPPIQGYAVFATAGTVVSNNLFYNNDVDFNAAVNDLGDNLIGDPLFVEGAAPDPYYALQFGSPALNAATGFPAPNMVNIGAYQGPAIGLTVVVEDGMLIVHGTSDDDKIEVKLGSAKNPGKYEVKIKNKSGSFRTKVDGGVPIEKIVVYGLDGNDDIKVDTKKQDVPAWLFGGDGDDKLRGDGGDDILVGGSGEDKLKGEDGRDLLIGGDGEDDLDGSKGEDILIGGITDYDNDLSALDAIMDEWSRTDLDFGDRMANLVAGVGPGNTIKLTTTTVHDDGVKDKLKGSKDADWFFAALDDDLKDLKGEDALTTL